MSWERKQLEDVADFTLGKMLDQKKNKGEPLPYLANVNVRWGSFDLDDLRQMRFEAHEAERFGLKCGDIVMCEGGEPGRCAIWKDYIPRMMIQKALHRIRSHDGIDNRFLFYTFLHKGKTGGFSPLFTGSTIKHLPREKLAKVEVDIPPLLTQQRIASILSAYDDLIENNRRRIHLLEQAARLLYKEWFVHLRFPGHEHVKFKEGVPEGWARKRIGEIADVIRGKSYQSSELREAGGKAFVTLKCIKRFGGFRTSGLKRFEGDHKEHHQVVAGDIVMAVTDMTREAMIVAQAGLIPKSVTGEAIFSMDLVKIVPKGDIQKHWLYLLLRHSGFSFDVREHATGTNVLHLKPKYIESWEASLPPKSLRDHYSDILGPMIKQQDQLELQIQALTKARDLLLPRLMNGEVVV